MAQSIEEIQLEIFNRIASDEKLATLNSTSKVAIYRLFVFVVSYSIFLLLPQYLELAFTIDPTLVKLVSTLVVRLVSFY